MSVQVNVSSTSNSGKNHTAHTFNSKKSENIEFFHLPKLEEELCDFLQLGANIENESETA